MRGTAKAWMIANFEIIISIVLSIIMIPFYLLFISSRDADCGYLTILMLLVAAPYGVVTRSIMMNIFFYLIVLILLLIFYVDTVITYAEKYESLTWIKPYYLFMFLFASVVAFFCSRYAKNNFHEVTSRRMLYRNSNVSLFEMKWKYTIDRFCNISLFLIGALFTIGFAIVLNIIL
jgi:hypothetical protein